MKKIILILLAIIPSIVCAGDITIAVASNFVNTMEKIVDLYESEGADRVIFISGSSGKHYAQIKQGAPYDIFYSADTERPSELNKNRDVHVYAKGVMVIWMDEELTLKDMIKLNFDKIAIANPRLAPYGKASQRFLKDIGVWDNLGSKLIMGENVSQVYHYIISGNVDIALLSMSHVKNGELDRGNIICIERQAPILQGYHIINKNADTLAFSRFMNTARVKKIIHKDGYHTSGYVGKKCNVGV